MPYYAHSMPNWYKLLTPHVIYPGKVSRISTKYVYENFPIIFLKAVFLTSSIFMMISIAVERYTAVFYPFSRSVNFLIINYHLNVKIGLRMNVRMSIR